jgi:general secretion pathway protein I
MARRPDRGFTLLEVMVALAVLALAMVALSDAVGGALRNHVRARQLDVATLLARMKLNELTARFEEEGFRDADQSEDGDFEDDGHPEISWKMETVVPSVDLGAEGVVKALTGVEGGVAGLLGMAGGASPGAEASAGGPTPVAATNPMAGAAQALLQQQLVTLGEQIKKGVREVRLTVSWKDGAQEESFTVVTHLVVLTPRSAGGVQ